MIRRLVGTSLVTASLAASWASAGAQTAPVNAIAPVRVRWTMANTLVYADSGEGVRFWLGTNYHTTQGGQPAHQDVDDGFAPDSVEEWTVLTRQLLALSAPPVRGDTSPVVSSGFLRGRKGTVLIAARTRDGDRLREDVRLLVLAKGKPALAFDLAARELDTLVSALETAAMRARAAGLAPATAPDSTTEVQTVGEPRASLRYPADLKRSNVEGEVWADFEVDTTGRANPSSVRVLLSDDPGFERAVRAYIVGTRYRPATLRGRPVRTRTHQRFGFALTRYR